MTLGLMHEEWRIVRSLSGLAGLISTVRQLEDSHTVSTVPRVDERTVNVMASSDLENRTLRAYASFNCSCKRSFSALHRF